MKTLLYRSIFFLTLVFCSVTPLHAASSWLGGGASANWSDPGNWDNYPSGVPDLVFATVNQKTTNTNDFSPGLHINSLTFNSTAAAFTLSGNPIDFFSVNGTIVNNSSNTQTLAFNDANAFNHGITTNDGPLTINAANADFHIQSNISLESSSSANLADLTFTGSHNTLLDGAIDDTGENTGSPNFLRSGVIKNGSGTVQFNFDNTYRGGTTINAGTVIVNAQNALGFQEPNIFAVVHNDVFLHGGTLQTLDGSPRTFVAPDNYTQDGGTLRIQIGGLTAGTTADQMQVGRSANLGGEVFFHRINNFMPAPGDRVTFLTTNNGTTQDFGGRPPGVVNGTFDTFASDFPGLIQPTPDYFTDHVDAVFQLSPFTSVPGLTRNQNAVAVALNAAVAHNCLPVSTFTFLGNVPISSLPTIYDLIAPEEYAAMYQIQFSHAIAQSENIQRRLDDVRTGSTGYCGPVVEINPVEGKNVVDKNPAPPPVVAPETRWGFFVNGGGDFAQVNDEDENAPGYKINSGSVIGGIDYRVLEHFAIGIYGGYLGSTATLVNRGHIDLSEGNVGGYATWWKGGFYVDAGGGAGWSTYKNRRDALLGAANGDTNGSEVNAMGAIGYDWKFRLAKNTCVQLGPVASAQYIDVNIDSFRESGSLIPLQFPEQDEDSLTSIVGARASLEYHADNGFIITPAVRAAWLHEYNDRAYPIDARFVGCPGLFTVYGPRIGRDAALVDAGVSIQFNQNIGIFGYYDGVFGRNNSNTSNSVSGGLRLSF